MKTLRFIGMALFAVLMCVNFASCSNDDGVENQEPQKYTISLGCVGEILNVTHEPLSRTEALSGLYTVKVLSDGMVYAEGTFNSVENLTVELIASKIYNFEVTYEPNNSSEPTKEFKYEAYAPSSTIYLPYYEESDFYYGLSEGYAPSINGSVEIYMKRIAFGIKATVNNLADGATVSVNLKRGYVPTVLSLELTSSKQTNEKIFTIAHGDYANTYSNIYKGILTDGEYVNYYEEANLSIILTRVDGKEVVLIDDVIIIERNKKSCITITIGDSDTETSNGLSITKEDEEMGDGNQYKIDGDAGTIIDTTISTETE